MSHQGTKVDLGNKAPVVKEGAGIVDADSLAAESYREGGKFAQNADAEPQRLDSNQNTTVHGAPPKTSQDEQGQTAPSYIVDTKLRDLGGPHGKDIREDKNIDSLGTRDGLKRALRSEPGSGDDPSRLAEQQLEGRNAASAAATSGQDAKGQGQYDALDRKISA